MEVALVEILGLKEGVLDVRLQDYCLLVIIFFLERDLVITLVIFHGQILIQSIWRVAIVLLLGTIHPHNMGIINHPLIRINN